MTIQEEEARIAEGVQKQLAVIIEAQQKQFAQTLEVVMKNAVGGLDGANSSLEKERLAVQKELDAVKKLRTKTEKEGEKMASAFFENRQKQFQEAARTDLLRQLALLHLGTGKTPLDIANWLNVPTDFVENIRQLTERNAKFNADKPARLKLEGNPKVRVETSGRGGTIRFESRESTFDMWWEFAGGEALAIVGIPMVEHWEKETRLPLARREEILQFIGEHLVDSQTGGRGSFVVGENVLTVY